MSTQRWTPLLLIALLTVQTVLLAALLLRLNQVGTRLAAVERAVGLASVVPPTAGPAIEVDPGETPPKGAAEAAVEIVEFSCFTCPSCARLQPVLDAVLEEFPDSVQLSFRYFPLSPDGKPWMLASGAECAGQQGAFWQAHDRLFERSKEIEDREDLWRELADLGLDEATFLDCLDAPETARRIGTDQRAGVGYGVKGTPTLFVNGREALSNDAASLRRLVESSL
jgi:protein-disulfide isomerase